MRPIFRFSIINHLIAFLPVYFVWALLSGCSVSPYHLGYHHLGQGRLLYSVVSGKTDKQTGCFENQTMGYFTGYDAESLHSTFSPKLASKLSPDHLIEIMKQIKDQYELNGLYERMKLVDQSYGLSKGNRKDAFSYYDMVSAEYYLFGQSDALIRLFISKLDGELMISGFEIADAESNPKGNNDMIEYVFPESVDRAGLLERGIYGVK